MDIERRDLEGNSKRTLRKLAKKAPAQIQIPCSENLVKPKRKTQKTGRKFGTDITNIPEAEIIKEDTEKMIAEEAEDVVEDMLD